jgi:hypothetical protein
VSDDSRSDAPVDPPLRPADALVAPATMLVSSRTDYLDDPRADIGVRVGPDQLELFVEGEPADALWPLMLQRRRDYIALHDVGTRLSLRLLGALAAALKGPLQQLAIRRQGQGVPLATIRFVEVTGAHGEIVRVYSTDVDADSRSRAALSDLLLASSRLGVMLVGELPAHVLERSLQPVRDAITRGPWLNRDMLLVPLAAPGALPEQGATLSAGTAVRARVTPVAGRPTDIWSQVIATWNRLGEPAASRRTAPANGPVTPPAKMAGAPTAAHAATAPPMSVAFGAGPEAPGPGRTDATADTASPPGPPASDTPWGAYLETCRCTLRGFEAGCVFRRDADATAPLAHAGPAATAAVLMRHGRALRDALDAAAGELDDALGERRNGTVEPDATALVGDRLLILHPLPGANGVLLCADLDARAAHPAIARQQLVRVDARHFHAVTDSSPTHGDARASADTATAAG